MRDWLEKLMARAWNYRAARRTVAKSETALDLGVRIVDERPTKHRITVPQDRRAQHIVCLGRTGGGKSRLLRYLATQDVAADRGWAFFDHHGEETEALIAIIAAHERKTQRDLSDRLIVIAPSDFEASVGLNPLEEQSGTNRFVQISEFAQILKQRWHLDSLGARTDELMRNSLHVLAENGLTLLELVPLLSDAGYRTKCLKKVANAEIREYFSLRFDSASDPMQATMREPILNKTSAFTADPHFRHVIGQARSTFSIVEALDAACWIILSLPKGRLGEQASTLASLFFTKFKNAIFARKNRKLFTVFCDEIQNLIAFDSGIETVLTEARKFAVGIISANQFLDQYPPDMRAAILAIGTHICFQLSGPDANHMAAALDGGKPLADLLKNLPHRHMVVKTGHERWREAMVPTVRDPQGDWTDLYARSRARWARRREEIENEIRERHAEITRSTKKALDDWE